MLLQLPFGAPSEWTRLFSAVRQLRWIDRVTRYKIVFKSHSLYLILLAQETSEEEINLD
jgi:hypothetical protein